MKNTEEKKKLKEYFGKDSAPHFTNELNINNRMSFLNVLVDTNSNIFLCVVSFQDASDHGSP